MKRRLFWKILFGFWLTFVGIIQGVWLTFEVVHPDRTVSSYLKAQAHTRVVAAATAYRYGGQPALNEVVAAWPVEDRKAFRIRPLASGAAVAERATVVGETVQTPAGPRRFAIDWAPPKPHGLFGIPWEVIDLAVIGGLIFSAVLAWYLTRPIQRLRQGFGRLAEGDLTVRLHGQMGRRRDELADLAGDFDQMADRLQQLVSSRDRLLHDVSHELRSPLARLHMAIGLARQNPQKIAATLERIELEAGRLDELVGELLTLARIEGDDPRLDQYVDLVELIGAVAEDARFEAEQVGVAVRLRVEDFALEGASRLPVKGNGELLRRGLENVVRNAIRFSSRGQHVDIVVELRRVDGTYLVEIADEGPGAPEAALETMFEPFVRLHEGERGRGFGLGLAIARRAVAAHRGAICARNRSQGGLAVSVELPAEAPALAS